VDVFCHADYVSPWWARPSARDGRFHRAGEDVVQYAALHPLGPAAEFLRHEVGPEGDPATVRLDAHLGLWAAQPNEAGIVLVDFYNCSSYGIAPEELVGDDYEPAQRLADRVRDQGSLGMIVPSAALPGTMNLILFGSRLLVPYLAPMTQDEDVPTGHLADDACAPEEVVPYVRWFGTPHRALEQWKAEGRYDAFEDPRASRGAWRP
jgi:RES domain